MLSLGEDHGWLLTVVWLMDYIPPIFKMFKSIPIFIGMLIMITLNGLLQLIHQNLTFALVIWTEWLLRMLEEAVSSAKKMQTYTTYSTVWLNKSIHLATVAILLLPKIKFKIIKNSYSDSWNYEKELFINYLTFYKLILNIIMLHDYLLFIF